VRAQFHPTADWPGALPAEAEPLDMRSVRNDAFERVAADLPVATRLYSVRTAVESAPADTLLRDLMPCVVAADCWKASLPCPQEGFTGTAWTQYIDARRAEVIPALSAALARSVVLERIPVSWIPREQVSAQLVAAMARAGFRAEVTAMQLIPPNPGGDAWVGRDCGDAVATLSARARRRPVAAMLHWPNRTAAAIVAAVAGRLKAFGVAFGPDGVDLDATALAGVTIVPAVNPPMSFWMRCARIIGLRWLIWRWMRHRRVRLGGNPLAAI